MAQHVSTSEPQDGSDRIVGEVGAAAFEGRNIGVTALLEVCREHARFAFGHRTDANERLHKALASTLELYHLGNSNEENRAVLNRALAEKNIRLTKRTDAFTPLVKLVFADTDSRSNINRYAGVLRLALANDVKPTDLADFIRSKEGIAKCAILEVRMRRAAGTQIEPQPPDLGDRRAGAVEIDLPKLGDIPTEGRFTLLVEPAGDGKYLILGARAETEKAVARYLTKLARK